MGTLTEDSLRSHRMAGWPLSDGHSLRCTKLHQTSQGLIAAPLKFNSQSPGPYCEGPRTSDRPPNPRIPSAPPFFASRTGLVFHHRATGSHGDAGESHRRGRASACLTELLACRPGPAARVNGAECGHRGEPSIAFCLRPHPTPRPCWPDPALSARGDTPTHTGPTPP